MEEEDDDHYDDIGDDMIISECKILEIKYRYVNVLHLQNNVR
jgi:hypothetical protein